MYAREKDKMLGIVFGSFAKRIEHAMWRIIPIQVAGWDGMPR